MASTADISDAHAAAQDRSVFLGRPDPGILRLTGDDAAEFLQGQVTNDIEALGPGEGAYAALLTPKGKMRADMHVLRTAESLLLVCDRSLLPTIREMVERFRVGFAFKAEDLTGNVARITLAGPRSGEALRALDPGATDVGPAEGANVALTIGGANAFAYRGPGEQLEVLLSPAAVEQARAALLAVAAEGSPELFALLSVETATPVFGVDVTEAHIPGEAGLNDRAVNFEKGCYVGQETVARMHYKGKPNRHLRGLKADSALTAGEPVVAADGRELGFVGTSATSPSHGPIALAVLRREAEPGDKVTAGDVQAEVVDPSSFR